MDSADSIACLTLGARFLLREGGLSGGSFSLSLLPSPERGTAVAALEAMSSAVACSAQPGPAI